MNYIINKIKYFQSIFLLNENSKSYRKLAHGLKHDPKKFKKIKNKRSRRVISYKHIIRLLDRTYTKILLQINIYVVRGH